MGVIGLLVLLAAPADAIVGVEPSTVATSLVELLRVELGPGRVAPLPRADLWARIDPVPEGWRLTVRRADGPTVLVRRLTLAEGEGPALRIATLLITLAARGAHPEPPPPSPPPPPPSVAPPPIPPGPRPFTPTSTTSPRPLGLRVALGPGLGLWRSPLAPRIRVWAQASLEHELGFLAAGAELGAGPGLEAAGIGAQLIEAHWRLDLGAVVWARSGLRGLVLAGLGYARYEGDARALVYADPGTVTEVGPIGRVELSAAVEFRWSLGGGFDLFGRLGARFGLAEAQILLPPGFSEGEGLTLERLEPDLVLGLGWRII